MELSLMRGPRRLLTTPTLVCFLLKTFDLGLSIVDVEEPASEGVRILMGASSLGKRDVDDGGIGLLCTMLACCTFGEIVPLVAGCSERLASCASPFWLIGFLEYSCCSSEGLLF